ncbi:DoxX family protein [Candidatus Peregrinibacteria bacterium]|nr:DoxX family protein [Candidatus Peregrinibacteria bacterium]
MKTNCEAFTPYTKLLLRLMLGVIFIYAGWGKINNIPMVEGMLTGLSIPFPAIMAWVLAIAELVCGALLVLGLWTCFATIPVMFSIAVAFFTLHLPKEGLMGMGSLYVALIFFSLLHISASGPGKISLDHKVLHKGNK